jgi:hypothetical protein
MATSEVKPRQTLKTYTHAPELGGVPQIETDSAGFYEVTGNGYGFTMIYCTECLAQRGCAEDRLLDHKLYCTSKKQ